MPIKFTLRNDTDHMRLVTLVATALAAVVSTLQVLYPFATDPSGWGAQGGGFGNFFLMIFVIGGVLLAGVQYARWDLPKLRAFLRWGAVAVSSALFVIINIGLLMVIPEVMEENAGIVGIDYFYAYNYSMLMWQAANVWALPMFAVGVMRGSKLDRWLLVGFASAGTVFAVINAWFTYTYERDMPAMIHHWIGYILPPVLLALAALCSALVGVVRKNKKTAAE